MNAIELLRKRVISDVMDITTMANVWPTWRASLFSNIDVENITGKDLVNIGNRLTEVFKTTGSSGRGQSDVSAGGTAWECLVCWYLNLCTLNSNTVVIKAKKANIPESIRDAITVKYGSVPSNTESDIVAITFPSFEDDNAYEVDPNASTNALVKFLNDVVITNFEKTCLTIIQCKTNWNDNAQIPMLWDLIYSSTGFNANASVGQNGFTITGLDRFRYAFATVPTTNPDDIKETSVCVLRVAKISGGNYWGLPTKKNVASNIFDIIHKNFPETFTDGSGNWHSDIAQSISTQLQTDDYFKLSI